MSPAWHLLEARWEALLADARATLADWEDGRAVLRSHRLAADLIQQVAQYATAEGVYEVALAVFMLERSNPQRFRSDRATDFQAARRVRALAPSAVGSWWSVKEQRVRMVYRDAAPKGVEVFGAWLRQAFAGPARQLADIEGRAQVDREAIAREERQRLVDALEALQ